MSILENAAFGWGGCELYPTAPTVVTNGLNQPLRPSLHNGNVVLPMAVAYPTQMGLPYLPQFSVVRPCWTAPSQASTPELPPATCQSQLPLLQSANIKSSPGQISSVSTNSSTNHVISPLAPSEADAPVTDRNYVLNIGLSPTRQCSKESSSSSPATKSENGASSVCRVETSTSSNVTRSDDKSPTRTIISPLKPLVMSVDSLAALNIALPPPYAAFKGNVGLQLRDRSPSVGHSLSSIPMANSLSQLWASQNPLLTPLSSINSVSNLKGESKFPTLEGQYYGGSLPDLSLGTLQRLLPSTTNIGAISNENLQRGTSGLLYVIPSQTHIAACAYENNSPLSQSSENDDSNNVHPSDRGPYVTNPPSNMQESSYATSSFTTSPRSISSLASPSCSLSPPSAPPSAPPSVPFMFPGTNQSPNSMLQPIPHVVTQDTFRISRPPVHLVNINGSLDNSVQPCEFNRGHPVAQETYDNHLSIHQTVKVEEDQDVFPPEKRMKMSDPKEVNSPGSHNVAPVLHHSSPHQSSRKVKGHKCDYPNCGRTFTFPAHLKSHIQQTHICHRPCVCEFEGCGKRFYTPQHLTVHYRSHTGERPFVCPYDNCAKAFTTAGNLKNHIRTHTGERPYECQFRGCDRRFAEMSSLKKHELTHTGEKPYECRICGKRFSQAGSRNTHERRHNKQQQQQQQQQLPQPSVATVPSQGQP